MSYPQNRWIPFSSGRICLNCLKIHFFIFQPGVWIRHVQRCEVTGHGLRYLFSGFQSSWSRSGVDLLQRQLDGVERAFQGRIPFGPLGQIANRRLCFGWNGRRDWKLLQGEPSDEFVLWRCILIFSSFLGPSLRWNGAHRTAGSGIGSLEFRLVETGRPGNRSVPVFTIRSAAKWEAKGFNWKQQQSFITPSTNMERADFFCFLFLFLFNLNWFGHIKKKACRWRYLFSFLFFLAWSSLFLYFVYLFCNISFVRSNTVTIYRLWTRWFIYFTRQFSVSL